MRVISQLAFALAAVNTAVASPLESRTGLVKRMFWCNGHDSHVICPPGERMVPMEQASCQVLRDAGRLNDASPPQNGERYYDCGRDNSGSGSGSGSGPSNGNTTTTSTTSTPPPPPPTPEQPVHDKTVEKPSEGSAPSFLATGGSDAGNLGGNNKTMNMTCTKIDGVIGQWETLNCTMQM